eukprot:TRINITY_DN49822_c0_g1_i1.p1 TRINITY_DN49822_c0_g1~~TRINITY_DN49822_c0_g1_i1.p1  ORF type:complete len:202 (-),score=21.09 TRINITY_DN49822_c0_g1_i1:113-718(-)
MGCTAAAPGNPDPNPENPVAKFQTSLGTFEAEIFLDRVPVTASSFIDLAQIGFYDGIHFHRVIKDFMNQFGCPYAVDPQSKAAGSGSPPGGKFRNLKTGGKERRSDDGNIKDERTSMDSNTPGTLSMANSGRRNSGGCQFFINVANNSHLDWFSPGPSKHPVFGRVIKGYDVCETINCVDTVEDNPIEPILMKSITIRGLP